MAIGDEYIDSCFEESATNCIVRECFPFSSECHPSVLLAVKKGPVADKKIWKYGNSAYLAEMKVRN